MFVGQLEVPQTGIEPSANHLLRDIMTALLDALFDASQGFVRIGNSEKNKFDFIT
jgi:hypothetical protein